MKKIFLFTSLFIFLFLLLIWSSNIVFARVLEGSGTEEDPYQIGDCEELQYISEISGEGYYFILNNDIDCSMTNPEDDDFDPEGTWGDEMGFMPIGYTYDTDTFTEYGDYFVGTFDGNNHTISDLYINRPTYNSVGLFGFIGNEENEATIKDVGLLNVDIIGKSSVGGLVGYNGGHIENSYTTGTVEGEYSVGGLAGVTSPYIPRTILNSHSSCNVVGESLVGGLAGANFGDEITNSYATGDVTGEFSVGGLVGQNVGGGNIENSYATGDVECSLDYVLEQELNSCGGLVGLNEGSHIENSYATGEVTGFIAGGLVGQSLDKTIVNSYATGDITGSVAGGLIGYLYGDFVYNSYSTGEITPVLNEQLELESGQDYVVGGSIGLLIYGEGESPEDYIFNLGWYKSRNNSLLHGIGMTGSSSSDETLLPDEVTYTETNSTAFYSRDHGIYENAIEYAWEFNGNPWYEYSNNYPKFVEQEGGRRPGRSSGGSGSSTDVIASFQAEQLARAIATGVDTTPYLTSSLSSANNEQVNQTPNTKNQTPTLPRTLKLTIPMMQGDDVKSLQTYLNTHGYDCGIADGVFGSKTKQAVIKFQLANNLVGDGVVGLLTQSKMN